MTSTTPPKGSAKHVAAPDEQARLASELAGLGPVPAGWHVDRLKWFVEKIGSGKTPKGGAEVYEESGVVFLRSQNIHFAGLRLDDVAFIAPEVDEEMAGTRVRSADVLLNITGASLGRCCIVPDGLPAANVNQHVCIVRPNRRRVAARFLAYMLGSDLVQSQIFSSENGVSREGLNFFQIANLQIVVPDALDEQQAIVAFLDRETAKIDAMIAKKEGLIALLEEKRAALISHAVTKGLDPNVPMKDSGIDWLGPIPAHWQVFPLRRGITTIEQGWSPVAEDRPADETEWAVMKLSAVKLGHFYPDEHKALPADVHPELALEIREGDVLVTRGNTPDLVADACVVEGTRRRLMLCDLVYRLHMLRARVNSHYLVYWLLSRPGRCQIKRDARGSSQSMVKVSQEHIRTWFATFPPLGEQRLIVDRLRAEEARLDSLVLNNRKVIAKLQEYRTALISAAVTGKIDVRASVEEETPQRQANVHFLRSVAAAEIITRLHTERRFGRIKLQKLLYLSEHHVGVELEGQYKRDAAGPFDNQMMHSVESQMEKQDWYRAEERDRQIVYVPLSKAGGHREYFHRYWGSHQPAFDALIDLLRRADTRQCEMVATLYAAWNDMLLDGGPCDDDAIVHEVLTNWHPKKQRIPEEKWRLALEWMRTHGLRPRGRGRRTSKTAPEDNAE